MPIKMEGGDEQSLALWFCEALAKAGISNPWGIYIDDNIDAPKLSAGVDAALKKHLDVGGLVQFTRRETHRIFTEAGIIGDGEEWKPLAKLGTRIDTLSVAKELVSTLKQIPNQYTIIVRGPQYFSEATKNISINLNISPRLKLISSSILSHNVKFASNNPIFDDWIWRFNKLDDMSLAKDHVYFAYDASGYIGDPISSKLVSSFLDELRSFYGACLAHKILWPYHGFDTNISPVVISFSRQSGDIGHVKTLDSDLIQTTYFSGWERTRFNKPATFAKFLSPVIDLFNCSNPKLKTASIWLLRAKLSSRPMDRLLESAIALEVLLGDQHMSDRVGLTKLMANRCAYALSYSSAERDELMKFFIRFYKLRSDLVHTGRLSNESEDENAILQGLELAERLLVYEQRLDSCSR